MWLPRNLLPDNTELSRRRDLQNGRKDRKHGGKRQIDLIKIAPTLGISAAGRCHGVTQPAPALLYDKRRVVAWVDRIGVWIIDKLKFFGQDLIKTLSASFTITKVPSLSAKVAAGRTKWLFW